MPATRLQEKARKKYISVKEFQEQYSLSKSQAYRILSMSEMQDAVQRMGKRLIRIDLDRAFEIMQQIF